MCQATEIETLAAGVHQDVFFREFTFNRTQFSPSPGDEQEFADAVAVAGDALLALQVKERAAGSLTFLSCSGTPS